MLDLPSPVAQQSYRNHGAAINTHCVEQAKKSMSQAHNEVREFYDATGDQVVDATISSDSTWQRWGFSSLFGAVFAIEHKSGKVVDYLVFVLGVSTGRNVIMKAKSIRNGRNHMNRDAKQTMKVQLPLWSQKR